MRKLLAILQCLYDRAGDPRTKNAAIALLAVLTLFGMIAPDEATAIRDLVLSMAL